MSLKVIIGISGPNCSSWYTFIVLSTGYMGQIIEDQLGKSYKDLKIEYIREKIALGTGGAIKNVAYLTKQKYLMVINGDTYHNISRKILNKKITKNCNLILCMHRKNIRRYGQINLGKNNLVESINEKSNSGKLGLINIGTYIIHREKILDFPLKEAIYKFLNLLNYSIFLILNL